MPIGEPNYLIELRAHNYGKYKRAIVCGRGKSASELLVRPRLPDDVLLIGVNDVGALYSFHFVVALDDPATMKTFPDGEGRVERLSKSLPMLLTNRAEWQELRGYERPTKLVLTKTGKPRGRIEFNKDDDGEYRMLIAMTTPMSAAWLAVFLGCEDVGIIGVDLLPGNVFEPHSYAPHTLDTPEQVKLLRWCWEWMEYEAGEAGSDIYNLAPEGLEILSTRVPLEDFLS